MQWQYKQIDFHILYGDAIPLSSFFARFCALFCSRSSFRELGSLCLCALSMAQQFHIFIYIVLYTGINVAFMQFSISHYFLLLLSSSFVKYTNEYLMQQKRFRILLFDFIFSWGFDFDGTREREQKSTSVVFCANGHCVNILYIYQIQSQYNLIS